MSEEYTKIKYATDRETLESECDLEFIRDGGPGGQHRNRRETGVRLHHPPSGITVTAVERRSQALNLDIAYERLAHKLQILNTPPKKRRPTKTPWGEKRKRLDSKKKTAAKKSARKRPSNDDW